MATNKVAQKGLRVELERTYPHGNLDSLSDVRHVLKLIGRTHVAAADVHAIIKYLDSLSQWRGGDNSMKWSDLVNYIYAGN